jgi:acyl-CoA synthetase (AMP-forming)/AMP-acid ligase II
VTTVIALLFPLKPSRATMLIAITPSVAQDVYLNLAPLFHIGGLSYALAATLAGAVHVFPEASAAFAPARRLSDITAYGVTVFIAGERYNPVLCTWSAPSNNIRRRREDSTVSLKGWTYVEVEDCCRHYCDGIGRD